MPVADPHDTEEPFDAEDVEDEAPFRDERPVGEEAVEGSGSGTENEHPLEGGQTDAVDEAQEERARDEADRA